MARVSFTPNLQRYLSCPPQLVAGSTVAAVLSEVLAANPRLESYLLDDQGLLRPHVNVFVDGEAVADRRRLSDPVAADAEVYVMQALSGG